MSVQTIPTTLDMCRTIAADITPVPNAPGIEGDALTWIPDKRFRSSLRANAAASLRDPTGPMRGLFVSWANDQNVVTVWTWSPDYPISGRKIAQTARQYAGKYSKFGHVVRLSHKNFQSPDYQLGVASVTTYQLTRKV